MHRRIADVHPRQPRQLGRLVEQRTARGEDGDLLERDGVGVERGDDRRDPTEAVGVDVPPPRRWERVAGADRRPDIPAGDPDRRRSAAQPGTYLTEPASSPWTK
jgi:hypothetical protein